MSDIKLFPIGEGNVSELSGTTGHYRKILADAVREEPRSVAWCTLSGQLSNFTHANAVLMRLLERQGQLAA